MSLGVIPRKTGKESFPIEISAKLFHHFIRGFFDGDGITDIKRRRSGFISSNDMLKDILIKLDNPILTIHKVKRSENIYYFLGGIKFSRVLYDYMYSDANVWLTRKKERLKMICFK